MLQGSILCGQCSDTCVISLGPCLWFGPFLHFSNFLLNILIEKFLCPFFFFYLFFNIFSFLKLAIPLFPTWIFLFFVLASSFIFFCSCLFVTPHTFTITTVTLHNLFCGTFCIHFHFLLWSLVIYLYILCDLMLLLLHSFGFSSLLMLEIESSRVSCYLRKLPSERTPKHMHQSQQRNTKKRGVMSPQKNTMP